MTTSMLSYPRPNKERGQRSIDISDLYLTRFTPPWARPPSVTAYQWRAWVLQQPVAIVCRETLIASLLSLDWKITPRNSKYRDELDATIRYYTKLIANGGDYGALQLDWSGLIEWLVGDLLDTPFGMGAEIGRKGDSPDGRVVWIRPLDAGTLFPTLNDNFPVVQYYMQPYDVIAFPYWSILRAYMSPYQYIFREGWGMAPPEKIYFALEMLNRGDKYYANLLLDVPTAGILDLGDMEKSAAEEWATAFKTFVQDQNVSFRVPVLYEHNNPINFLPFGKVPNDIMFDRITMKYAALVAAAYGMSLSDIGLQTTTASGETLAGSIRQERRTKKTGFARIKTKVKSFFDRLLPDTLEFNWVDYDDELNVALGRARLASSQAFSAFRQMGLFSEQELRSQAIQDGLVSISLPDELPPDAKPDISAQPNAEPELLQGGKAPSAGGEGEVKSIVDSVSFKPRKAFANVIHDLTMQVTPKVLETLKNISEDEIGVYRSAVAESIFDENDALELSLTLSNVLKNKSLGTLKFDAESIKQWLTEQGYERLDMLDLEEFQSNVKDGINGYLGKSILFILNDVIFEQSAFDGYTDDTYNNIVQTVQERMEKSLTEFVKSYIIMEVEKLKGKLK